MDATTVVDRVVIPAGATKADVQSLYEVLASVPDGRKRCEKRRWSTRRSAQNHSHSSLCLCQSRWRHNRGRRSRVSRPLLWREMLRSVLSHRNGCSRENGPQCDTPGRVAPVLRGE